MFLTAARAGRIAARGTRFVDVSLSILEWSLRPVSMGLTLFSIGFGCIFGDTYTYISAQGNEWKVERLRARGFTVEGVTTGNQDKPFSYKVTW